LVDHEVTVELKNDIQIRGTLKSVDQYLNIKLDDIQVVEELKYPHLVSVGVATRQSWKLSLKRMYGIGADVGLVLGQKCLHSRQCGQIRAFTWQCGRYGAIGRWFVLQLLVQWDTDSLQ
jgi:small nuclear ribonucleoprotein (snRNP)-like protein